MRRNEKRRRLAGGWCAALLAAVLLVFSVKAMELGGFDVMVGEGENGEVPSDWWEDNNGDHVTSDDTDPSLEDEVQDMEGTVWEDVPDDPSGWNNRYPVSDAGEEEVTDSQFTTASKPAGEPGSATASEPVGEPGSATAPEPAGEPGSAMAWEPVGEPEPTKIPTPAPTQTPPPTEAACFTVTPTPAMISQDVSTAEVTKLKVFYAEETCGASRLPEWKVRTEGPVHVLSFRINGVERPWHWEKNTLMGETETSETENVIELLLLYEEETGIQASFAERKVS